jgi:hypothetical protein
MLVAAKGRFQPGRWARPGLILVIVAGLGLAGWGCTTCKDSNGCVNLQAEKTRCDNICWGNWGSGIESHMSCSACQKALAKEGQ